MTFDIPRTSHKYLKEPISKKSHLKIKLVKKFINFPLTLSKCDKPHIRYLQDIQKNDRRSVFGRNSRNIFVEAGADSIQEVMLENIKYEEIPLEEEYRVPLVLELLKMRAGRLESELTSKEVSIMLNQVCYDQCSFPTPDCGVLKCSAANDCLGRLSHLAESSSLICSL